MSALGTSSLSSCSSLASTAKLRASRPGACAHARAGRLNVSAIGGLFGGGKKEEDKMCRNMVNEPKAEFVGTGKTFKVTFQGKGDDTRVIECRDDQYILDAADENGIDLPATCRGGICGACVAKCTSGKVDQTDIDDLSFTMDEDEIAQGMTLICMARPASDVTLETQCDWGYSLGVAEWKANGEFEATPVPLIEYEKKSSS